MILLLRVLTVTLFVEHFSWTSVRSGLGIGSTNSWIKFRPGFSSACPTRQCFCLGQGRIECAERYEKVLPDFHPDPENVTYEILDLSVNRIRYIPPEAFRGVKIKKLKVWQNTRKNEMRISEDAFKGLGDELTEISFRANNISTLPSGLFRHNRQLTNLDFQDNRILGLSNGTFYGLKKLMHLTLSRNLLHTLEEGSFNGLTGLQSLDLERNRISFIDTRALKDLTQLRKLNLDHNQIRDLQPMVFSHLPGLIQLQLSGNRIPALFPLMFKGLENLEKLNLSRNPLMMIAKDSFGMMKNLRELRLEKCKLTYFKTGVFDGLTQLRYLYLHSNFIRSLPDDLFHGLHKLKKIQLSHNQLTTLNACSFDHIWATRLVLLLGNPIQCDCGMAWTALPRSAQVRGECVSPEGVKNQEISSPAKYEVCRFKGYEDCDRAKGSPQEYPSNHVPKSRFHRSHGVCRL